MSNFTLKFGDLVIIQGTIQPAQIAKKNLKSSQGSESTGFLSAVGFTENRVFVQTVPPDVTDPLKAASTWNNYRELIFQVWPKCAHEAQKQLKKLKKEKRLMAKNVDDDTKIEFEEKMTKMENRAEEEREANKRLLLHVMGTPVFYGTEIQLMHETSRTFLTSRVACSDSDKSAYKFELSKEFSSGMAFKLLPRFQIRQEGEPIQRQDQILIYSMKLDCFVNFAADQVIARDRNIELPPNLPSITSPFEYRYITKGTKRYEAHISQFKDCVWKMHYYGKHRYGDETVVRGGDLVKLKHSENDSFLAADLPMQGKNPEVYGRVYYGEFDEEKNNINTIWEIEDEDEQNRGETCELKDKSGKPKPFRLRHLLTGKLLTINPIHTPEGIKSAVVVANPDPAVQKKNPSVILHTFANNSPKEISYNSAYAIGLSDDKVTYKFVTLDEDGDYAQIQISKEQDGGRPVSRAGGLNVYKPLSESELCTNKHMMLCEQLEPKAEHAFILSKVGPEEEYEILYAASAISRLKNSGDLMKACKKPDDISGPVLTRTIDSIKNLIFFVHKVDPKTVENANPITFEGITIQERQRMLKDFRVIELLTEILFYPFHLKLFTLEEINHKSYQMIFQLCYRLIKHIIKEYRPNEIYAAQWLEYYMSQAMKSNPENDIKAEATLIELIDNNKKILDTKIDREMIFKFVNMIKENKNTKFVNLLRALCVCDGEAVVSNQTDMSRFIIEDEDTRNLLIFQDFRVGNDGMELRIKDYEGDSECWATIPGFERMSKTLDDGEKYDYFISMIYLLADLCLQRNYVSMDYLETVYTYDICSQIISAESSTYEVKSAFARLLNNLWIDRKPYQPLNLPQYLIIWDEITPEKCEKITSDNLDGRFFDSMKKSLQVYFGALAKDGCTKIYEMEKNQFTSILLELAFKLVSFGQYKTIDELKELTKPLLKVLNGMRDVTTPEEYNKFKSDKKSKKRQKMIGEVSGRNTARYIENEDTLVVMNCKKQICQLLKVIMSIADDLCLRKFLLSFRGELGALEDQDASIQNSPATASPFTGLIMNIRTPRANEEKKSLFGNYKLFGGSAEKDIDFVQHSFACFQKLSKKNPLDFNTLAPTNFARMLFDLTLYENDDLVNNAFELLNDAHSQRYRLKDMLNSVQILEDPEKKKAIQEIEKDVKYLKELSETTENWYGNQNPDSMEQAKKCAQLIKKMGSYLSNDSGFGGPSFEPDAEVLSPGKDKQTFDFQEEEEEGADVAEEDQMVNSEFQKILRHLKANEPLLDILKFENANPSDEKNEMKIIILKEVFKFLSKFVRSDKTNQNSLVEYMPIYLRIMKNYPTSGAESLIEALFKDNKVLLRQSEQVIRYCRNILKIISELKPSNHKSSKFLLYLKVCMKVKKQVMKANQTIVLSQLTLRENTGIFLQIDTDKKKAEILKMLKDFNDQIGQLPSQNPVELPGEIDYINSLLEVMGHTCEGKNAVTESRSQTSWPLKSLALLYENSGNCWLLKRAVLLFFYHVYLDTEREMKEEVRHIEKIFLGMIQDMETAYENQKSTYEVKYHKGVVDDKTIQDQFYYDALLPCINDFLVKRFYAEIPNYIDGLTRILQSLLKTEQMSLSRGQRKDVKGAISKFKYYTNEIYKDVVSGAPVADHIEQKDNPRDISPKKMAVLNGFGKEENTKTLKLRLRLSMLNQKEEFSDFTEEEFKIMIRILINIEKTEESDTYSSFLPFNDVIKSLISLFDVSESNIRKDLMLVGLKMFRKIIERENKLERLPAAEWEGEAWTKFGKKIVDKQNQLCNLGMVEMICNTISQTKDIDLQLESILVGIALLIGGNLDVQGAFLEYMQQDSQNKFLWTLKGLIDKHFGLMKKEMTVKTTQYLEKLLANEAARLDKNEKVTSAKGSSAEFGSSKDLDEELEEEILGQNNDSSPEDASLSLIILQRVYRFLQLFCEGHNLSMQNHLRHQTNKEGVGNGKSYDFMTQTTYHFNSLIKQINVDCLDVGVQMLDFLIEGLQGPCEGNQQALAKANIINSCMDFLTMFNKKRDYFKYGFIETDQIAQANDATTTAMKLLNALIERNSNPDIIEEMTKLDFSFLIKKLTQEYETFVTETLRLNVRTRTPDEVTDALKADSFNQQILESFDIYILIANLADSSPQVALVLKDVENLSNEERNALSFFRKNVENIEILFNDKLLKIYFPMYPMCRYLTRDSRKRVMASVNRESPNEKIMGLINAGPELFEEMSHMAVLQNYIFVFSQKRYNYLKDLSTLISFLINIIILVSTYYQVVSSNSERRIRDFVGLDTEVTINVLGYCQLVTSSLMIVFWVIINAPMVLRRKWRETVEASKVQGDEQDLLALLDDDADPAELPLNIVLELLRRKGPYDPVFNPNGKRNYGHLCVRLVCYWRNLIFIAAEGKFVYSVFYFIVSILGITVSEITYSIHLLDIINRFDTLRNVIKAVTYNIKQLLLTALLGVIVIFVYTIIGFYFLDDNYFNGDIGIAGERTCTSMFQCYMTTLNYGLRNGGGIGESLVFLTHSSKDSSDPDADDPRQAYYFRAIFDITFYIIINVVFLNIIFGIIIDTFAELRDQKSMMDEDMKNLCYICNLDRYTFDKNGTGFENHIENHHHLWNYLYFIYSVQVKDSTEYNGIESNVYEKLQNEDISWFPLHKALELATEEEAK